MKELIHCKLLVSEKLEDKIMEKFSVFDVLFSQLVAGLFLAFEGVKSIFVLFFLKKLSQSWYFFPLKSILYFPVFRNSWKLKFNIFQFRGRSWVPINVVHFRKTKFQNVETLKRRGSPLFESNWPHVGPGTEGGVSAVGVLLKDPSPHSREFRRKPKKTPNG